MFHWSTARRGLSEPVGEGWSYLQGLKQARCSYWACVCPLASPYPPALTCLKNLLPESSVPLAYICCVKQYWAEVTFLGWRQSFVGTEGSSRGGPPTRISSVLPSDASPSSSAYCPFQVEILRTTMAPSVLKEKEKSNPGSLGLSICIWNHKALGKGCSFLSTICKFSLPLYSCAFVKTKNSLKRKILSSFFIAQYMINWRQIKNTEKQNKMFESLQFPSHFHSSIYMDFYVTKKKKKRNNSGHDVW